MAKSVLYPYLSLLFSIRHALCSQILLNHTTILHDNADLQYSAITSAAGADCESTPGFCSNYWWVQPNPHRSTEGIAQRHATTGPSASLSLTFTGSRALSVLGEKDASVQTSATLNGQPYPVNMTNYPELFRTEALDNGTTYTFTLYYGGTGLLSVTVLFIEKAGHTLPTPRTPDPDPAPVPSQSSTVSSTTSESSIVRSTTFTVASTTASEPTTSLSSDGQSLLSSTVSPSPAPNEPATASVSSLHSPFPTSLSPESQATGTSAPESSHSDVLSIAAGCAAGGATVVALILLALWLRRQRRSRSTTAFYPEPLYPHDAVLVMAPLKGRRDHEGTASTERLPTYTESRMESGMFSQRS